MRQEKKNPYAVPRRPGRTLKEPVRAVLIDFDGEPVREELIPAKTRVLYEGLGWFLVVRLKDPAPTRGFPWRATARYRTPDGRAPWAERKEQKA